MTCEAVCQGLPWGRILDDHWLWLSGRRDCSLAPLLGRCDVS